MEDAARGELTPRVQRDVRATELVENLASIEDRLDPLPRRRGQRLADLLIVAIILVATLVFDIEVRYPVLLIALLVTARGLTRSVSAIKDRSLHREREQLLMSRQPPEER